MGFNYNGALRAPEVLIRESYHGNTGGGSGDTKPATDIMQHIALIRRRETFDTLFGNTVVPADLATSDMNLDFQHE